MAQEPGNLHMVCPHKCASLDTMCIYTLAKVAECVRFDIDQEHLDTKVTLEGFISVIKNGDSSSVDAAVEAMSKLFLRVESVMSESVNITFRELLSYESPSFPVTTRDQRRKLVRYSQTTSIVTKPSACVLLGVDETDPLIKYLFASGVEALPSEVLQDVVACLETHPDAHSFPPHLASTMVATGRRMMTLLPYIIMIILGFVYVPRLASVEGFEVMKTVLHFIEADWAAGCPEGTTSPLGCKFIQRNLNVIETVEFDAMRYVREEFILRMWQEAGRTAAEAPIGYVDFPNVGPIGSTYPVGALLVRFVDEDVGVTNSRPFSCEQLNISETVSETRVGASYSCDAQWAIFIPFNSTQEEALALAAGATLPSVSERKTTALIMQFAAFAPDNGLYAYTTVTLSLPPGGHVITRIEIRIADLDAHESLLPLLIMNAFLVGIALGFALFYSIGFGRPLVRMDLLIDVFLLIFISAAYGILRNLKPPITSYNVDFVPLFADTLTKNYYTALVLVAVWSFFTVSALVRYAVEIGALHIVVAIVQVAGLQIASLLIVFGIWTVGFAVIAKIFFGPITVELATQFNAFTFLFSFFSGGGNYDVLEFSHPALGPLFWYVYKIFVTFFALNLLIAVLTAPLADVKEACNLHLEMYTLMGVDVETDSELSWLDRQKFFFFYGFLWPLVNVVRDGAPNPMMKLFWLRVDFALRHLTEVRASKYGGDVVTVISEAQTLLDLLTSPHAAHPYETLLVQKCKETACMDPISMAFTLQALASMSPGDAVRDARLMRALMLYDMFTTNMNKLLDEQVSLQEVASSVSSLPSGYELPAHPPHLEHFHFTLYVKSHLRRARVRFLLSFIFLAVFLWMYISGLTINTDDAFLSASLDQGLRDFPIHQECYDADCASAFSFRKTWMDTGDIADLYVWVDTVLLRQLYFPQNQLGKEGMFWDRRTKLEGPIYWRQVRGAPTVCEFDEDPSVAPFNNDAYRRLIDSRRKSYHCSAAGTGPFDTRSFAHAKAPGVNLSAYEYRDWCPEVRRGIYLGYVGTYQCDGFVAATRSEAEVRTLMAAGWIDNATRLVAITANFTSGSARVEYTLLAELGRGGGICYPQTMSVSLTENRSYLLAMFLVPLMILSIDLLQYIALSAVAIFQDGFANYKAPMKFPVYLLGVYFFTLVLPYLVYLRPNYNERLKLQIGVMVLAITYRCTKETIFPIAGLLSKDATKLFDTLAHSASQCALILPFYAIFLLALSLAGTSLFGNSSVDFAMPHWSILTVLRGALGDWDTSGYDIATPEVVEIYNIVFFAIVLIMLANLILAMVTSAAGDAMAVPPSVNLAERVCRAKGWHPMYGAVFECALAWNVWWLRRQTVDTTQTMRRLTPITVGEQRLLFLAETLVTALGPHRANEVLGVMGMDLVNDNLYPSAVIFILQLHADFCTEHRVEESTDRELEQVLLSSFVAADPTAVKLQPTSASGVFSAFGSPAIPPPTASASSGAGNLGSFARIDDDDQASPRSTDPIEH